MPKKGQKMTEEQKDKLRKPRSEETKTRISKTRKIRHIQPWNKDKKTGQVPWNKGKKGSQEGWCKGLHRPESTKKKISEKLTGRKLPPFSKEHKRKIGEKHKGKKYDENTKQKIREARLKQKILKKDTSIEVALQKELTTRNIEYKKQAPVCNICFPDISFPLERVAVFADGDYWHNVPSAIIRDNNQNKILQENGWKVLRFWEHEIQRSVEKCVDQIIEYL